MIKLKKCKYNCFKQTEIKNIINYRTWNKLKLALEQNKRLSLKYNINNQFYTFKVTQDNHKNWGVVIRNITKFSSYAILIPFESFKNDYKNIVI